jgi:N6-adenosine-specific RNA methylase IME4
MTALALYDRARTAIQRAASIDEAKDIADKAEAMRAYARLSKDPEMERWVSDIRVRAKRKLGELSAALEHAPVIENVQGRNAATLGKRAALAAAGITKDEAHRCEQLAKVAEPEFEAFLAQKATAGQVVTGEEVARLVVKATRKAKVATAAVADIASVKTSDLAALTTRGMKFGTVLADPPWIYGNQGTRGATGDHYVGMTVAEIAALPIAKLAAPNAHLHLWTTNAFLFESKQIMEAWGFEYRSCYVWVKPQMGMGNYWRVSHEFLLLGIRGSCPFADRSLMSWGQFPRGKHSAKPDQIRSLIEKASPGPRLELFGRRPAPGWVVWGNEIERTVFDDSVEELVA